MVLLVLQNLIKFYSVCRTNDFFLDLNYEDVHQIWNFELICFFVGLAGLVDILFIEESLSLVPMNSKPANVLLSHLTFFTHWVCDSLYGFLIVTG